MRSRVVCLCFLFLLVSSNLSWGAEPNPKTFAVLPFHIHGPQKFQYLEKGIQSMLISRLTWKDHLQPVEDSNITATSSDIDSRSKAEEFLTESDADILFWGAVTIMGNEASVDIKMFDTQQGNIHPEGVQTSLDQLIPSLEKTVAQMNAQIFQRKQKQPSSQQTEQQQPPATSNKYILSQKEEQGETYLNPQFKYAGSSNMPGRWRSQSFSFESNGMVAGDADNDGINELFILTSHQVRAYRFKQNKLEQLAVHELFHTHSFLNINLIDLNRDGMQEIIVSSEKNGFVQSFILNFLGESFEVKAEGIDFYLNVVRVPPEFSRTLVGQRKGTLTEFEIFQPGVHRVVRMSGKYELGERLNLPSEANVFNFNCLPYEQGYKIIVADRDDKLRIFDQSNELQAKTEEMYAGSDVRITVEETRRGRDPDTMNLHYFVPTRILPMNIDDDDQFELIVNRNISVTSEIFSNYRQFPQSEIHTLFWSGVGLSLEWKTRTIKGSVIDYGIEDIDNDNINELYVCLNTHPGSLGIRKKRTIVLGYDLKGIKKQ